MTKFWALIISTRPHVYNIGEHENAEQAEGFSSAWCDQRNEENIKKAEELRRTNPEVSDPITYDLAYVMDDEDMRQLTGEVHRPRRIARKKREVAVEVQPTHGGECQCQPAAVT